MSLPTARSDGMCADCRRVGAETRDGRFCKKCLRARIRHDVPGQTRLGPWGFRGADKCQKPGYGDPSPSGENAVRRLEDG